LGEITLMSPGDIIFLYTDKVIDGDDDVKGGVKPGHWGGVKAGQ